MTVMPGHVGLEAGSGAGAAVGVEGSGNGEGAEGASGGGDFGERGNVGTNGGILDLDSRGSLSVRRSEADEARAEDRRRNARARLAIVLMIALMLVVMMLDGMKSGAHRTDDDEVSSTGPSRGSSTSSHW